MSSTIEAKNKPTGFSLSTVTKASTAALTSVATHALAAVPKSDAKTSSTSCTKYTDAFESPAGNKYAVTSCNTRTLSNVIKSFEQHCGAKSLPYEFGASLWHPTRWWGGGTVTLGVEHYGVNDPSFQQCMDNNNAGPIHAANIYEAKLAGMVVGGIVGAAALVGIAVGAYKLAKHCVRATRQGIEHLEQRHHESHALESVPAEGQANDAGNQATEISQG